VLSVLRDAFKAFTFRRGLGTNSLEPILPFILPDGPLEGVLPVPVLAVYY
jgi:hypothetical protein